MKLLILMQIYRHSCMWFISVGLYSRVPLPRYNAVLYSKIFHKWLQELRQNMNQMLDPQKTPYTSPQRGSYGGVFCEYVWEIDPCYNGTAL